MNNAQRSIAICFIILILGSWRLAYAQRNVPLWEGKGRIIISSDGNEHDNDDWAATPFSLALLAARGLQDRLALYTYSDHVWGSNHEFPNASGRTTYENMRESALGAKERFRFDNSLFICAVDSPDVAYNAVRDEINRSSKKNPLIIIAAGPMQVIGEGLSRARKQKRKYVTVLSHSNWNNDHAADTIYRMYYQWEGEGHKGWTFNQMKMQFASKVGGGACFIQIADQNREESGEGLLADREAFEWLLTSPVRNDSYYSKGSWEWLYYRLETSTKEWRPQKIDVSDSGMILFVLTGIQKTTPAMAQWVMENPKAVVWKDRE